LQGFSKEIQIGSFWASLSISEPISVPWTTLKSLLVDQTVRNAKSNRSRGLIYLAVIAWIGGWTQNTFVDLGQISLRQGKVPSSDLFMNKLKAGQFVQSDEFGGKWRHCEFYGAMDQRYQLQCDGQHLWRHV
jgi:hypothetical protein